MGFFFEVNMETTQLQTKRPLKGFSRDPVKLTALLYLKEALLKEKFEDCAFFIEIAYEFGAQDREVEYLLEDPRRIPR